MEYGFEATVVLELIHNSSTDHSKHKSTRFALELIGPLKRDVYIKDDLPTDKGSEALTITLVQGLVGNIHLAHEKGWRDSAEHLRWIISELEKGFAAVGTIRESTFGEP